MNSPSIGVVRLYVHVEPEGTGNWSGEDSCNHFIYLFQNEEIFVQLEELDELELPMHEHE